MAEKKKYNFKVPQEEFEALLHQYCRNFTTLAAEGRYDPIVGRDSEIDQVMLILLQRNRKNAVLLAPAGVGKTALVVGLAQAVVAGRTPDYLKGAQVLELDMSAMAAGTTSPGEFQERFIPICRGIAERYQYPEFPRYIMFIDEIHTIMPTVHGSAYAGLSEVMKPYLTVGDLHVIGATTLDEFRMYVAVDTAMDRRFQKVNLKVPSSEETVKIMQGIRPSYEKHHKLTIPDECIVEVVKMTDEYMKKRGQPDKSIVTMDAACAWQNMYRSENRTLTIEAVHQIVAKETSLHVDALSDKNVKYAKTEAFDPTKMAVQVGSKNFNDADALKQFNDSKKNEDAAE